MRKTERENHQTVMIGNATKRCNIRHNTFVIPLEKNLKIVSIFNL